MLAYLTGAQLMWLQDEMISLRSGIDQQLNNMFLLLLILYTCMCSVQCAHTMLHSGVKIVITLTCSRPTLIGIELIFTISRI